MLLILRIIIIFLQNYIRKQDHSKVNYNLVHETLQFLDCICGSTSGGLGLLGLYINETNVGLINQCLESLTEYCQGPCHENQVRAHSFSIAKRLSLISSEGVFCVSCCIQACVQPALSPEKHRGRLSPTFRGNQNAINGGATKSFLSRFCSFCCL